VTSWRIIEGDCVEAMRAMPAGSVDAVVCDPPYGLEFMGREWDRLGATTEEFREALDANGDVDYHGKGNAPFGGGRRRVRYGTSARAMQAWHEAWALEALRVLKPGGHLLAFGGTRTYHRLTCAIEDAGFEIRDCLAWLYGSGFPKSLDVSKAIDKGAGAEREVVGRKSDPRYASPATAASGSPLGNISPRVNAPTNYERAGNLTAPATPDAEYWQGWGTALKPAHEPIVLARKPLTGTVAGNVLAHGTGALNVDGCRIDFRGHADEAESKGKNRHGDFDSAPRNDGTAGIYGADLRTGDERGNYDPSGRWPANVILDPEAAALLDEQTGDMRDGTAVGGLHSASGSNAIYARMQRIDGAGDHGYGGSGGASRFFYCPKADTTERNTGLHGQRNSHPTVKPVALMRWLCRLITPPGGTILDPFTGSGTTGIAALREGFAFIGIEREPEYASIARARIIGDAPLINGATELAA
jgi:DNA modification methylase